MNITVNVEGMSCQHCVANVKGKLEALDGITEATPSLQDGNVVIEGSKLDVEAIRQAVSEAGYSVTD